MLSAPSAFTSPASPSLPAMVAKNGPPPPYRTGHCRPARASCIDLREAVRRERIGLILLEIALEENHAAATAAQSFSSISSLSWPGSGPGNRLSAARHSSQVLSLWSTPIRARLFGQQPRARQIVERRYDQPLGQIAIGAEDHDGAGRAAAPYVSELICLRPWPCGPGRCFRHGRRIPCAWPTGVFRQSYARCGRRKRGVSHRSSRLDTKPESSMGW